MFNNEFFKAERPDEAMSMGAVHTHCSPSAG